MNATFNPAPLSGLAAFTAGHRWFAPPAKFRDHARAAFRLSELRIDQRYCFCIALKSYRHTEESVRILLLELLCDFRT